MTREDLIAAAEALEEMAEHLDGLHLLQSRDECLKKARELRAQAEAMNNGAATNAGRAHVNLGTSGSATEDAAPPSAAQPVAQVVCNPDGSDKRVIFHSHRALYETPLGTFLYATPPDLAARVEELECAMQEILRVHANDNVRPRAFYIASAALAKGEV